MKKQMLNFLAQLHGLHQKVHNILVFTFYTRDTILTFRLSILILPNARIFVPDIDLYGFCPERDTFYTVVCETCHAIVKPQALIQHMGMLFYNSILIVRIRLLHVLNKPTLFTFKSYF